MMTIARILTVACIAIFWAIFLQVQNRGRYLHMGIIYRANIHSIGSALALDQSCFGAVPTLLGQLVDDGEASCDMFELPNNGKSIAAAEERRE